LAWNHHLNLRQAVHYGTSFPRTLTHSFEFVSSHSSVELRHSSFTIAAFCLTPLFCLIMFFKGLWLWLIYYTIFVLCSVHFLRCIWCTQCFGSWQYSHLLVIGLSNWWIFYWIHFLIIAMNLKNKNSCMNLSL
jgi:hypothetical protein